MKLDIENIIRDKIIEDIENGVYEADDKLPSDNELAGKYDTTRITIRNLYKKLEEMGYVYSLQGRGRFVMNKRIDVEISLAGDESFSKKLLDKGYNLETINLGCSLINFNKKIYDKLHADYNDKIYRVDRLRVVDNIPLAIHTSYLCASRFNHIEQVGSEITSIFKFYKDNNIKNVSSSESVLRTAYPCDKERTYLKCRELVPLLKVESNCIDEDTNTILEYTEIIYRGDIFSYKIV